MQIPKTIPPYLSPGDTVGLVSVASKVLAENIIPAVRLIEKSGFRLITGKNIYSSYHQFAATDTERAHDLQTFLDDESIRAILCTRGGYGTLRTLQYLNWEKFRMNPKWIIGFSDITVLHAQLNRFRIASIHAAMPKHFLNNDEPTQNYVQLFHALTHRDLHYTVEGQTHRFTHEFSGEIVGGNLSVLYSLRGTPLDMNTRGKILFIEDLGEYLYHVDRMMMNLKTGGKLDGLKALVVGSFTEMKDTQTPFGKNLNEIILDVVKDYSYPVLFHFPAGHSLVNYPIKLGMKATFTPKNQGYIFHQS